jgi:hypothetical protein
MAAYTLRLIGGEADEVATFTSENVGRDCRLTCNFRGEVVTADADDFLRLWELFAAVPSNRLGSYPFAMALVSMCGRPACPATWASA